MKDLIQKMKDLVQKASQKAKEEWPTVKRYVTDFFLKVRALIQRLCLKVKAEWPSFKRMVRLLVQWETTKTSEEESQAIKAEITTLLSQTKTILTLGGIGIVLVFLMLIRGCGDSQAKTSKSKYDEATAKRQKQIQEYEAKLEEAKKHAYNCSVGGIKYTYFVAPEGVAVIVRSNAFGDVEIPKSLGGKPVEIINDNAFAECVELTSVKIPHGVTGIFKNAFRNCTKLETVTVPKSVSWIADGAFKGCTSLRTVSLPEGKLYSIDKSVFEGCTSLVSVTIPDSVYIMGGSSVFKGCTNLRSITLSKNVNLLGNDVFRDCVNLRTVVWPQDGGERSRFRWTMPNAFRNCTSLKSLPEGLKGIDENAFMGCINLKSVRLCPGMLHISAYSFFNCKELTSVSIPDGIVTIQEAAFAGCPKLTELTLPETVEAVKGCFFGCDEGFPNGAAITFLGKPPRGECTVAGDRRSVVGYYTWRHCEEWEKVIDSNGRWHGIKMKMK